MSTLDGRPPPPQPPTPPPPPAPRPAAPATPASPAAAPKGRPAMPPTGRRLGRRTPTPVATSPEGLPTRRRWGRFAAGATLALLGAWVFAALYVSAGQRVEVLALANDVGKYQELTRDDLRTVRVAADPTVEKIAASQADDLVGRVAAVELRQDTLLAEDELLPKDERVVQPGEAKVGMLLGPEDAPTSSLVGGTPLIAVIRSEEQGADPERIDGCWFLEMGDRNENTGKQQVTIVVPTNDADDVSEAAGEERVTLIEPGEG